MKVWIRSIIVILLLVLSGCASEEPASDSRVESALASLEKLDVQPAYTLDYTMDYQLDKALETGVAGYGAITKHFNDLLEGTPIAATGFTRYGKACTGFTATGQNGEHFFCHNEDWYTSNYVVLTTRPAKGYASVSVCGVMYPEGDKKELLAAPFYPLSGINSEGLCVSTYSVSKCNPPNDPEKKTLLWPVALRLLLDRAATVEEALELLDDYNILIEEGNEMQFLIGDASGSSAIVAWVEGKAVPVWKDGPWQAVTNFVQYNASPEQYILCNRYYKTSKALKESGDRMTPEIAMKLLGDAKQYWAGGGTQFSVVFNQSQRRMDVAFGRRYEKVYTFSVEPE